MEIVVTPSPLPPPPPRADQEVWDFVAIGARPLARSYPRGATLDLALMTNRKQGFCGVSIEFSDLEYASGGEDLDVPASEIAPDGSCGWRFTLPSDAPLGPALISVLVISYPGKSGFLYLQIDVTPAL